MKVIGSIKYSAIKSSKITLNFDVKNEKEIGDVLKKALRTIKNCDTDLNQLSVKDFKLETQYIWSNSRSKSSGSARVKGLIVYAELDAKKPIQWEISLDMKEKLSRDLRPVITNTVVNNDINKDVREAVFSALKDYMKKYGYQLKGQLAIRKYKDDGEVWYGVYPKGEIIDTKTNLSIKDDLERLYTSGVYDEVDKQLQAKYPKLKKGYVRMYLRGTFDDGGYIAKYTFE